MQERLFVIKIGGNIINNEKALQSFLKDFSHLEGKKILVHGGGRKATEIGEKLGLQAVYVDGRRVTDRSTIDLVTMVYGGLINKQIVAKLQALGCNAIGLTGADANTIPADKRPVQEIDYGFVGDINEKPSSDFLKNILEYPAIPIFAPLTHDGKGQILNTNADTIASLLAVSLAEYYSVRLLYCFEKKGVLKDLNREKDMVPLINKDVFRRMYEEKALSAGILPKLQTAFEALENGVESVLIGHAEDLLRNTGDTPSGTLVIP